MSKKAKLTDLEKSVLKLERKIHRDNEKDKKKIDTFKAQLKVAKTDYNQKSKVFEKAQDALDDADERISSLESDIDGLEADIQMRNDELSRQRKRVITEKNQGNSRDEIMDKIDKMREEIAGLERLLLSPKKKKKQ